MRTLILLLLLCCNNATLTCKTKSFRKIEKKAKKSHNHELTRAVEATNAFHAKYKNLKIAKKKFFKTAYYIEKHRKKQKGYLPKKKSGLHHTIEHDPRTKNTFIVLDSKKSLIGEGKKKKVYKAIHYGRSPKIVARSQQQGDMKEELRAHKALQGLPGIMNTHAFTKYKHKKKTYNSIYSDLYQGTFSELVKQPLSNYNKLIIMSDLLRGLESIHSKNYVHRDLHTYNYLFHEETQPNGGIVIRAVIADLGRTIKTYKARKQPAQMTHRFRPPEGFRFEKMRAKDYFASDVYAMGCMFYRLFHNKYPSWQISRITGISHKKKLVRKLKKKVTKRRESLLAMPSLSHADKIELVILKMLDTDPKKRGTAKELQHQVQQLL